MRLDVLALALRDELIGLLFREISRRFIVTDKNRFSPSPERPDRKWPYGQRWTNYGKSHLFRAGI